MILFSSVLGIAVDIEFVVTAIDEVADDNESGVEFLKRTSLLLATVLSMESLLLYPILEFTFLSLVTELTILSLSLTPPLIPIKGEWERFS